MSRLAPLLALALLLGACGGEPATPTRAQDDAATSAPRAEPDRGDRSKGRPDRVAPQATPQPIPESLRFAATTVDGQAFDGADLAGEPVLLWFWAPWCPTCRSQVPQVEGVAADHPDDLHVIGVGSLDSAEAIAEFAGDVPGVTHLEDVDGALWRRFGVTEQSSYVLLDADGEVAFEAGYGGSDELGAEVDAVLGG